VRFAWAQAEAAKKILVSSLAQVKAAEAALNGVREEARLGQRTTYDVLNAQQELVNARIAVVSAERDRVVNSFAMLAAVGGLTVRSLGIRVPVYDAEVHYHQVRDAWAGVRAADGR
jgi:outer membrane protein